MNKIDELILQEIDKLDPSIELKALAVENANKLMEAGDCSPLKVYISARRMLDYLVQYMKELEYEAVGEYRGFREKSVNIQGVKVTEVEGYDMLDYEQDVIYQDLKDKLKQRKNLIDLVTKNKQVLADDDGVVVAQVKVKGVKKNSFQIKY